jgi:hypothetical protein
MCRYAHFVDQQSHRGRGKLDVSAEVQRERKRMSEIHDANGYSWFSLSNLVPPDPPFLDHCVDPEQLA